MILSLDLVISDVFLWVKNILLRWINCMFLRYDFQLWMFSSLVGQKDKALISNNTVPSRKDKVCIMTGLASRLSSIKIGACHSTRQQYEGTTLQCGDNSCKHPSWNRCVIYVGRLCWNYVRIYAGMSRLDGKLKAILGVDVIKGWGMNPQHRWPQLWSVAWDINSYIISTKLSHINTTSVLRWVLAGIEIGPRSPQYAKHVICL